MKPSVRYDLNADLGRPLYVMGDPHRVGQALTNLISNAAKFTFQGEIEVRLECRRDERPSDKVQVTFSVRDTGIGMAPDTVRHEFHHDQLNCFESIYAVAVTRADVN